MNFKDEMRDDGSDDADGCPHLQLLRDVWLDLLVVVLKATDPVITMYKLSQFYWHFEILDRKMDY